MVAQAESAMAGLNKACKQQRGAALMLLVFVIAIAMTTYLVKTLNSDGLRAEQEQGTTQNLAVAKEALISWAVSNSFNPGQLPYPDRLETTTPIYDGRGDCGGNPISNPILLLGQLPIYGSDGCVSPTEGLGIDAEDGYGNRLWYAVSPNLLHNYAPTGSELPNPIINPNLINTTTGWLSVRDRNGAVVSSRVAAVIIAPGNAIGSQSRSNTAAASNFLDEFQKSGTNYSNFNNNQEFVMGDSSGRVDEKDASYTRPYLFNDQLVYITIDELMEALEKRVGREVVTKLNAYYATNGFFPFATDGTSDACSNNLLFGGFPLDSCSTLGLRADFVPGENWFITNEWYKYFYYQTSFDCSSGEDCSLSNAKLTVGSKTEVDALIISVGVEIPPQDRSPATGLDDYMDSAENTNGGLVFDAVGTRRTSTYNDQMFIVAP